MNPTQVSNKFFHCADCGCEVLEEVMTDVVQSSVVSIIEDEAADYGEYSTDGGMIDRVQCLNCGTTIAEGNDSYTEITRKMEAGDPNFRDPKSLREFYTGLVCPDCGWEIPDNRVEGDNCPVCGHDFWFPKPNDDA